MNNNEILVAIAKVRRTGLVNMFNRQGVIDILYLLGYDIIAEYLEKNTDKYIELLELSANY